MSDGQHHHHSKEILLAKTYTGEAPIYVIHTVYVVAKGKEKALTDFLNSNFVETPPKGVIECRLASLKATGPNGTSKLSLIVYWNSGVDATSANQQAHKLNHDIQKLFGGVKPRSNLTPAQITYQTKEELQMIAINLADLVWSIF